MARHHSQWTPLARALDATGDHWTLLIALGLARGPRRPVQLTRGIAGISGAVLDRHVQRMVACGLVARTRYRERPPRVELELTDAGRELLPIAGALARWGMKYAWSLPAARELVDLAGLLDLIPLLVDGSHGLADGTIELVVAASGKRMRTSLVRRLTIEAGAARMLADGEHPAPQASVTGDREDWIAALGPEHDRAGLRVHGRTAIAEAMLAALPETEATETWRTG